MLILHTHVAVVCHAQAHATACTRTRTSTCRLGWLLLRLDQGGAVGSNHMCGNFHRVVTSLIIIIIVIAIVIVAAAAVGAWGVGFMHLRFAIFSLTLLQRMRGLGGIRLAPCLDCSQRRDRLCAAQLCGAHPNAVPPPVGALGPHKVPANVQLGPVLAHAILVAQLRPQRAQVGLDRLLRHRIGALCEWVTSVV